MEVSRRAYLAGVGGMATLGGCVATGDGSSTGPAHVGVDIEPLEDGYAIVGSAKLEDGMELTTLLRIDADARLTRATTIDVGEVSRPGAVATGADGILVGFESEDGPTIASLTPDGTVRWRRTIESGSTGTVEAVVPVPDGAVFAAVSPIPDRPEGSDPFEPRRANAVVGHVRWDGTVTRTTGVNFDRVWSGTRLADAVVFAGSEVVRVHNDDPDWDYREQVELQTFGLDGTDLAPITGQAIPGQRARGIAPLGDGLTVATTTNRVRVNTGPDAVRDEEPLETQAGTAITAVETYNDPPRAASRHASDPVTTTLPAELQPVGLLERSPSVALLVLSERTAEVRLFDYTLRQWARTEIDRWQGSMLSDGHVRDDDSMVLVGAGVDEDLAGHPIVVEIDEHATLTSWRRYTDTAYLDDEP